jgi:hypothetical protein
VFDTAEFVHAEHKHVGGIRRSYVVWSKREFAALERLANEVDPMPQGEPAAAGNPLGFVPEAAEAGEDGAGGERAPQMPLDAGLPADGALEGSAGGRNSEADRADGA